eukprot:3161527-Pyramimonas_sp.AAC.1
MRQALLGHKRVVELLPLLVAESLENCEGNAARLTVFVCGIAILRVVPEVVHEVRGLRVRQGIWRRGGRALLGLRGRPLRAPSGA